MLALYRGGRHADALATLHDLRRTLDEELGLVPSAALGELEQRILRHDPRSWPRHRSGSAALGGPSTAHARAEAEHPPAAPASRIASDARAPARDGRGAELRRGRRPAAALDPEDLHELSKLVRHRTAEVVERFGGCLAPAAGDQIIAGFGFAVAREDDVRRAVRAALELRDAIPDATAGSASGAVTVRVAVDTGMAIVTGDKQAEGMGCGAAVAATRLLAQAPAGPSCSARAPRASFATRWSCARRRRRDGGPWRSGAATRPGRRARPSSVARRSSRSWPSAIAAPRPGADRSCSSSASPASGSRGSWTSC